MLPAHHRGELEQGRGLEEHGQRPGAVEFLFDPGHETYDQQRMTAELEEIVVD